MLMRPYILKVRSMDQERERALRPTKIIKGRFRGLGRRQNLSLPIAFNIQINMSRREARVTIVVTWTSKVILEIGSRRNISRSVNSIMVL